MRTVVVGNRALAKHVLAYLLRTEWQVVGIIAPAGDVTRRQAGYVPFDDLAADYDLPILRTTNINDDETRTRLAELEPDLCLCPGWHQIIEQAILEIPARGFVGFHASDLPRGRGGAPVNWSIIHGDSDIAMTLFCYSAGVDSGNVIHKERIAVEERDHIGTVLAKLATAACDTLQEMRSEFESGNVDATPQSTARATYRPRRKPQDGVIDWSSPASELRDWVRAQRDPYPGAFTFHDRRRLTIWSADVVDLSHDAEPGSVLAVRDGEGTDVATGDKVLRLGRVQRSGEPRAWADDYSTRYELKAGDSLGLQHTPDSWRYTGIRDAEGGTDFSNASNLCVGESGEILAVLESRLGRVIDLKATLDGEVVRNLAVRVRGRKTVPIVYQPEASGTHTLRVEFSEDGEQLDDRYLKVFVSA